MKFCDVKMADVQGKTAKAGWQAPGELFYRRFGARGYRHHDAAQDKNTPGMAAGLPPAAFCRTAIRRRAAVAGVIGGKIRRRTILADPDLHCFCRHPLAPADSSRHIPD